MANCLFRTGFETGSGLIFDLGFSGPSIQTTIVRNGTYALRGGSTGSSAKASLKAASSDFSIRFATRWEGVFTTDDIIALVDSATIQMRVRLTGGAITILRGSTVVATASLALSIGNWHLIEILCKIANSGGVFDVKVDGSTSGRGVTFSGDTQNSANATANQVYLVEQTGNQYMDDITIMDQSTTYLGEGKILAMIPNAAGDVTTLNGTVGSATHWQNVDEQPPNDITDYNFDNAAAGTNNYDIYNLTAVSNVATVNGIVTWVRAMKNDAGTGNFRFVHKTGGTEYRDAADITLTESWAYYSQMREVNPNTTNPWTATELNALQAGFDAR